MAGYHNYSMSNNALCAYQCGEMPISKWSKADIIAAIDPEMVNDEKIALIRKASLKACKRLLIQSSWHHTSSYYNATDFYMVDNDHLEEMTTEELEKLLKVEPQKKPEEIRVIAHYLEWSGTRKHPKATDHIDEGIIVGNWFYLPNGKKKSIKANGFEIIKEL